MNYFILFDEHGNILGRYTSEIHGDNIPDAAIEVDDATFWKTIKDTSLIWKRDSVTGLISGHQPPTVPLSVPKQVSRAQGKASLITAGLWPDVLAFVEAITDPTEKALAEVALNDTTHWRRDSPTMQAISSALGIASEQMDDLFIQASQIEL